VNSDCNEMEVSPSGQGPENSGINFFASLECGLFLDQLPNKPLPRSSDGIDMY
jgi:hypothetical protein